MIDQKTRELNEFWVEAMCGSGKNTQMQKRAEAATNDYIRKRVLEGSFYQQILPAIKLENSDLDKDLTSRKPYKIVEMEPDSTGAMTTQFGTLPNSLLLEGEKIPVYFNNIVTDRYIKCVDELRMWDMDIRQILCDQQVKHLEWEQDRRFIYGVNDCLTLPYLAEKPNTPYSDSGYIGPKMWKVFAGGMTRENFIDSTNIMVTSPAHLSPNKVLTNTKTLAEVIKWGRDEVGGDAAQDMLFEGKVNRKVMGLDYTATLKRELVPDGRVYFFAEPKFLGRNYILEDTTMWVRNEAFWVEWFMYETRGGCIANISALACADFNPNALSDGYAEFDPDYTGNTDPV